MFILSSIIHTIGISVKHTVCLIEEVRALLYVNKRIWICLRLIRVLFGALQVALA